MFSPARAKALIARAKGLLARAKDLLARAKTMTARAAKVLTPANVSSARAKTPAACATCLSPLGQRLKPAAVRDKHACRSLRRNLFCSGSVKNIRRRIRRGFSLRALCARCICGGEWLFISLLFLLAHGCRLADEGLPLVAEKLRHRGGPVGLVGVHLVQT